LSAVQPHPATPRGGRISIRPRLEPAYEFSVIVHELLHRGVDCPASKTVRETVAEAVAFVVCEAIGLESGTAASDYIQLFDGETETLTASLDRIQKVAAEIVVAIRKSMSSRTTAAEQLDKPLTRLPDRIGLSAGCTDPKSGENP
jgi:hypothetical protein